jgi:microcystin-dependent protein
MATRTNRMWMGMMVLLLGLAGVSWAEDPNLGTVFSYQGRLETAGSPPLNGSYDFKFRVYDTDEVGAGTPIGDPMSEPNIPVTEGIFTVQLNPDPSGTIPNLFNGEVRYLEIAVRKTGSAESYFTISPRQRINAAPYAITASSARWLRGRNSTEKVVYVDDAGNVGIGTTSPSDALEVKKGRIKDKTGFVMPVGTILPYAGMIVPEGWLECNGIEVSRTTYADLFAAIGELWGQGDGSTTFTLPDLRGQFVRGWDHYAGVDPDSTARIGGDQVGSLQNDDYIIHDHIMHDQGAITYGGGSYYLSNNTSGPSVSGGGDANFRIKPNSSDPDMKTGKSGGKETRPKNAYVMFIINY